ncbi:hypothetical protein [Aequorivita lipolytica]|uniref:Uncharacterized protein n=1 Tax=Aequorivita lipolytica TaxID=153267 RepID=A0A5C6YVA7_9FLAO|nr:hypothetical protein [Aequorivita lipolytica]TXD70895.1 hypothetical protein ESV24_02055 [Aequorivita lipolytica]SRX49949.1 hypothetical protein AEQU2_00415 [Aequorivita lipolytica]
MTRFLMLAIAFFLTTSVGAQTTNLSDYSYVVVPEQFSFFNEKDKYQVNSMTKFYLEKSGFNTYWSADTPNANRCDGLYADVEKLSSIFGTKLQVVLKDCNNVEIYRSQEGKSKYKEFDKTYQDALRKAFNSLEAMNVKQKNIVLLRNIPNSVVVSKETNQNPVMEELTKPKVSRVSGNLLPDAKFSNYANSGKTFLLRKTADGYSLYEESTSTADGLLLIGKIIVIEKVVKYIDTSGKVSEASFDPSGNLIIEGDSSPTVYKSVN